MSTTLLPFLYQTPTLRLVMRAGTRAPIRCAQYHTDKAWKSGPFKKKSKFRTKSAIPFDLPADYAGNPDEPRWPIGTNDPKSPGTITPTERQAFERIFEEIASRNRQASTILIPPESTPPVIPEDGKEEAASVSNDIYNTTNDALNNADDLLNDSDDAKPTKPPNLFSAFNSQPGQAIPDPQAGLDAINIIIQEAAKIQRSESGKPQRTRGQYDVLSPLQSIQAAKDPARELLRYPPSLRRAARLALGVEAENATNKTEDVALDGPLAADFLPADNVLPGTDVELSPGPSSRGASQTDPAELGRTVSMEVVRTRERRKVEKMMNSAENDFELWDIMEREVFAMVDKLGLGQDKINGDKPKPKKSKKDQPKDGELSVNLHGPLYPSYLLFGLRALDQKFVRSSPLALNLLPQVKELGLASYVLGVSTPFYNTLASIYWYRYGDALAVLNLFEEMRAAGLFLDEDSHGIINNIGQEFAKYMNRFRDEFADVPQEPEHPFLWKLMKLPDFRALLPRTRYWTRQADINIQQRQSQLGF